jgi:hypothetical protein
MSLPFLTHPRIVRFMASDTDSHSFEQLTCFLNALCSSLQSPATLEDLEFSCEIGLYNLDRSWVDFNDGVWAALDGLVTDPLYARLRRVDVTMKVFVYKEVPAVDGPCRGYRSRIPHYLISEIPATFFKRYSSCSCSS